MERTRKSAQVESKSEDVIICGCYCFSPVKTTCTCKRASRITEVAETVSSYLPVVRSYRIPAHEHIQYLEKKKLLSRQDVYLILPLTNMSHTSAQLLDAFLSTTDDKIIPLTAEGVAAGCKVFGAAILRKSDLSVIAVATNNEISSPLLVRISELTDS